MLAKTKNNLGADVALLRMNVLGHWFTSLALMDFLPLGWRKSTDALVLPNVMYLFCGIIFFWIARIIMMTMHFM